MINNTNSGGMLPRGNIDLEKGHAKSQLEQPNDDTIPFAATHVAIWGKAKVDLQRFGTFTVNGVEYYSTAKGNVPEVETIFKKIFDATGDIATTMQLVKLLQQKAANDTVDKLSEAKGYRHILSTEDKRIGLTVDGKSFKVSQEILFKSVDIEAMGGDWRKIDPSKISYLKAKVITSGYREDLLSPSGYEKIQTQIVHTEEKKSLKSASAAQYQSRFSKQKEPSEFK